MIERSLCSIDYYFQFGTFMIALFAFFCPVFTFVLIDTVLTVFHHVSRFAVNCNKYNQCMK